MPLDEHLKIDTPEQVALDLPLAGVGSRFIALAVDTLLQAFLIFVAVVVLVGSVLTLRSAGGTLQAIGPVFLVLFVFTLYWGYFALFEFFWSGRTPGKRVAGIRVIKDSGRPMNVYEALARNVLRAVDGLPGVYAVGVIVMLTNRENRRLGDYVAGTVVVHDAPLDTMRPTWVADSGGVPHAAFARITAQELALVEAYLQRRFDLDAVVREERGEQIARRVAEKTGVAREPTQTIDEYLEHVARQARDASRFR